MQDRPLKRLALFSLILGQLVFPSDAYLAEKTRLLNLMDAFMFLSETHDLLHVMMGEKEGDPAAAYNDFSTRLREHDGNPELLSVRLAFRRISDRSSPEASGAAELDALVDYQQFSVQFGYQAIFKAHGCSGEIPTSSRELARLSRKIEPLKDLDQLKTLFEE
ncbi:MAG: hypothetical protein ACE5GH_04005 [Fidelibacterota bacterium]